jgi:hypothetical protein
LAENMNSANSCKREMNQTKLKEIDRDVQMHKYLYISRLLGNDHNLTEIKAKIISGNKCYDASGHIPRKGL